MSEDQKEDQKFIFRHLHEYLDEDLSGELLDRFKRLTKQDSIQNCIDSLKLNSGILQVELQKISLSQQERIDLMNQIRDPNEAVTQQVEEIQKTRQEDDRRKVFNLVSLLIVFSGLLAGFYFLLAPSREVVKKITLDQIVYEAMFLEKSDKGPALPSGDPDEVVSYLDSHPQISFMAHILSSPGKWKLKGGSLLDYESKTVAVAHYQHSETADTMFLFSYEGLVADLPQSKEGRSGALKYFPYGTGDYNMVAWQGSEASVCVLLGRESIPILAKLASGMNQ